MSCNCRAGMRPSGAAGDAPSCASEPCEAPPSADLAAPGGRRAPPSAQDARRSLNASAAAIGAEIYAKYGPRIGWSQLLRILEDRTCTRYPCEIVFEAAPLEAGEFAHPVAKGDCPADGFTIYVHPLFMMQLEQVPLLVLYQLVLVNYGAFASADDAETFGAEALGLAKDEYYEALCGLAEQLEQAAAPG